VPLEISGLCLLYVGVVLFVNGIWLMDKIHRREIVFIDTFVGLISFLVAVYLAFSAKADPFTIKLGALTFLFSGTYLWVAFNQHYQNDGRGLGWYSLFVAITASVVTMDNFIHASTPCDMWLAVSWGFWTVLWTMYFINLVTHKISQKILGISTIVTGIVSAWIPGYLILVGRLN